MKSIIPVMAIAGVALAGCGGSTPATTVMPTRSPSAVLTSLPDLRSITTSDERILVPLTYGTGSRGFSGGPFSGKTLYIEIACIGGTYVVTYPGGSTSSRCDGTPDMLGDDTANLRRGQRTGFTLNTNSRWVFRVTEAK